MKTKAKFLIVIASALLAWAPALRAQDSLAAAAKKIFTEHQDAVIWVSAVAKVTYSADGGRDSPVNIPDREIKVDGLGTIIDPGGLVVMALSDVDPARDITGREMRTRQGMVRIEASATIKEVKITMPDGTELPGEIVMRDADLDLAFLRPKPGSKELKGVVFKALNLKDSASAAVSDDVVSLSRMDEVLSRQASVTRGQITAVTRKPREFLRASGANLGCPTFAMDGKVLGIAVDRSMRGRSSLTVLIPAADVLEIAEQAKTARPVTGSDAEEKKAKEPSETK
jgi:S1-C subfamily serine protease